MLWIKFLMFVCGLFIGAVGHKLVSEFIRMRTVKQVVLGLDAERVHTCVAVSEDAKSRSMRAWDRAVDAHTRIDGAITAHNAWAETISKDVGECAVHTRALRESIVRIDDEIASMRQVLYNHSHTGKKAYRVKRGPGRPKAKRT